MSAIVLGLSAYYHDSAACLLVDGRIVAAAQEERFTRKKHDERFPSHAVAYCLKEAGIGIDDVGVQMGGRRRFTEGPFAGQTWGVDGQGDPFLVEEGSPSSSQGIP